MKKILIVDDEPNIVMSLEYTFKKNNFEVFIARDGQEALDILEKQFPDVIILDVMMPMVDGFATLEQIKKRTVATLQVIFSQQKNKEKDIKRTFVRSKSLCDKALFDKKISGTSTGINSIIKLLLL
jgi:DNA-binding response OmpR family regulator